MTDWESRWRQTWRELGLHMPDDVLAVSLADLLRRYREPQRHYHTLQHRDECFAALDLLHAEAPHPGEVGLALWFHDAVYDPQATDDEARSAGRARVLRGFLARPRIYATASFLERYEEAARSNLEHSLRA